LVKIKLKQVKGLPGGKGNLKKKRGTWSGWSKGGKEGVLGFSGTLQLKEREGGAR